MLDHPDNAAVEAEIQRIVTDVMAARGLTAPVVPEARLVEGLGLRSMDLAQIVLTLEDGFGVDPFRQIPITSIRTVGDLTQAYLVSLGLAAPEPAPDMTAELSAARRRRALRR